MGMKTLVSLLQQRKSRIIIGAALLVAALVLVAVFSRPQQPRVVIWNLNDTVTKAVRQEVLRSSATLKRPPLFIEMEQDRTPDRRQLRRLKADLIILEQGEAFTVLADSSVPLDSAVFNSVPSSARAAVTVNGRTRALPVAAGHFELAGNRSALTSIGKSFPSTLTELEAAAALLKTRTRFPILAAGSNDRHLGMLLGALIEARSGLDGWEAARTALREAENPEAALTEPALSDALNLLRRWQDAGYLHNEWLSFTITDVLNFMENRQAFFVFMDIETHRTVDQRIIDQFETNFVSSEIQLGSRSLTIPLVVAMPLNTGKARRDTGIILSKLAADDSQARLSTATGLSPVSATAQTPDRQAADIRFWLAASERPLTALFTAATADPVKQKALASAIRARLRE